MCMFTESPRKVVPSIYMFILIHVERDDYACMFTKRSNRVVPSKYIFMRIYVDIHMYIFTEIMYEPFLSYKTGSSI